jgi:hypothetical protein
MRSYKNILNSVENQLDKNARIDRIKYDNEIVLEDIKVPKKYQYIDWKNLIPSQPKNSSKTTVLEIEEIALLTHNRTKEDEKLIYLVDKEPLDLFYPILKKHNITFPKKIFDLIYKDVSQLIIAVKNYYNRPRPKQLADIYNISINVLVTSTHHTPSYPSGHTAYSALAYHLIKTVYPSNIPNEIYNCVELTGIARKLQGIHYQSDIDAALLFINNLFDRHIKPNIGDYYD